MTTKLPKAINTIKEAKQFLDELVKHNESFHPETDAFDIQDQPLTDEECIHLNNLMEQIFQLDDNFDPCDYIQSLIKKTKEE